jgi:hypothetical protein
MAWTLILSARLLAISLLAGAASSQCYYPDGSLAPDQPCYYGADSHCCDADWLCTSNQLCIRGSLGDYVYARGTCTDQSWNSTACPAFCEDGESALLSFVPPRLFFAAAAGGFCGDAGADACWAGSFPGAFGVVR